MSGSQLSAADYVLLDKYTKNFIHWASQVIILSRVRSGAAVSSQGSSVDQFGIALPDDRSIRHKLNAALGNKPLTTDRPIYVRIALRNAVGNDMDWEVWSFKLIETEVDTSVKTPYTVYTKLGLLLKSIISVSRVLPAYKFLRMESDMPMSMHYNIQRNMPKDSLDLGSGAKLCRLGSVSTPMHSILCSVEYRTEFVLRSTPHAVTSQVSPSLPINEDHFREPAVILEKRGSFTSKESIASHASSDSSHSSYRTQTPVMFSVSPAPSLERSSPKTSPADAQAQLIRRSPHFSTADHMPSGSAPSRTSFPLSSHDTITPRSPDPKPPPSHEVSDDHTAKQERTTTPPAVWQEFSIHKRNTGIVAAFVPAEQRNETKNLDIEEPFAELFRSPVKAAENQTTIDDSVEETQVRIDTSETQKDLSRKQLFSEHDAENDFVLIELRTPFAGVDSQLELNQFYRNCQRATHSNMFASSDDSKDGVEVSKHKLVDSVSDQVRVFDHQRTFISNFVSSLGAEED